MEDEGIPVPGTIGSSASLALRLGQTIFASASLLFISFRVEFFAFTSFCYLVVVMGLVIPWSTILAVVDVYSIFQKQVPRQPKIMLLVIVGDGVLAFLSLAAACSAASVTDVLLDVDHPYCPEKLCRRHQMSAVSAFLSWFLSFASSLFNLWVLPSFL